MIKPGLWHLTVALHHSELCLTLFSKFIQTGKDEDWAKYGWKSMFGFNLAHILDERTVERIDFVDRLCDLHDHLLKIHLPDTLNPIRIKQTLTLLYILNKEITKIWVLEVKRHSKQLCLKSIKDILMLEKDDPEFIQSYFVSLLEKQAFSLRKNSC